MAEDSLIHDVHTYGLSASTRELYLHGHYSQGEEEPGVDYRMGTTFIKNLHIVSTT